LHPSRDLRQNGRVAPGPEWGHGCRRLPGFANFDADSIANADCGWCEPTHFSGSR
jgi:hypothetical protein